LSHGHGISHSLSSLEGYAPLSEFWAAHGFAVLQPTHLSSAFLGLEAPAGEELFWQQRARDMSLILDSLDIVEAALPKGLKKGQPVFDSTRVAVAGHSLGAWTSAMLLGVGNTDPRDGSKWFDPEARIKAGILLAGLGIGGADMSDIGKKLVPFYGPTFTQIATPTLVVYGDEDVSPHLTNRGADWHADAYVLAPGPKDLLTLKGAKHGLGGISGWDTAETQDESPERLALVQRATWAYLKSQLYEGNQAWEQACKAIEKLEVQAKVESKK
jgi:pimeloyl-ACP methyl ester carboxylesterase